MSSRTDYPTQTTGAPRAHRSTPDTPETLPPAPPERYEAYVDGLFTYCLSVLCDHDSAIGALGDVLALAERRSARLPAEPAERKAWLYALARWVCLRELALARREKQGAHAAGERPAPPSDPTVRAAPAETAQAAQTAERRRRELALLAWPEAAGTTPEQRDALELAVRHGLSAHEVAAVLGAEPTATRELLAGAACEVERTRAALAVVETGTCPSVARLSGDHRVLLSAALRRELVRHVDDCPRCRRAAERAGAVGPWPGTTRTPAALPVLSAPRAALHTAMTRGPRPHRRGSGAPRFNRHGFPMDPKDRAARRDRLRARAVTTTLVATVVAAPVLALWAAYRGAPFTGEGQDGRRVSASEADGQGGLEGGAADDHYENAGNAQTTPDPRFTAGSRSPDVTVEVISPGAGPSRSGTGPGRLTVEAQPGGGSSTLITLTASGGAPVDWTVHTGAHWLYASRSSGTLAPGESVTVQIYVDRTREPSGHWSARIGVHPSGAVISVEGYGEGGPPPSHGPNPGPSDPDPSSPGPSQPDPSDPGPSDPGPSDPGPSEPDPSDPGPTEPDPTPTDPDPTPTGSPSDTPPPSGSDGPSPSGS